MKKLPILIILTIVVFLSIIAIKSRADGMPFINTIQEVFRFSTTPAVSEEPPPLNTTHINYQVNEYYLGDGKYKQTSGLGFANYKDGEEFKPINMTLDDYGDYWKTTKSVYHPTIPRYADDWFLFDNFYEGNSHTISIKPEAEHVEGIVNGTNYIVYPDAFDEGIDLEVVAFNGHLLKRIRIDEWSSGDLTFDFQIEFDSKLEYYCLYPNGTNITIEYGVDLKGCSIIFNEGYTDTIIHSMLVWDSNDSSVPEYITNYFYKKGSKTYFRKVISEEFLSTAVFPVYTDDDTGATYPGLVDSYQQSPEDDVNWSQQERIKADDNSYVYFLTFSSNQYTWIMNVTSFGFSVDGGATINGILAETEVYSNNANSFKDYRVQLYDDDGNLAGDNKKNANYWPTSAAGRDYGGASDDWSISPTPAMVNDADFGLAYSARSSRSALGYNDYIRLTIYYTAAAGDETAPTYSSNSTNSTTAGTPVLHSLLWTDDNELSGYIFSFDNGTGTFVNDSYAGFDGNWTNVTKIVNVTVGSTIQWCVYANDTSDNWNGTSCSTPFSYETAAAASSYERFFNLSMELTADFNRESNVIMYLNMNMVLSIDFIRSPILTLFINFGLTMTSNFFRNVGLIGYFNTNIEGTWSPTRNPIQNRYFNLPISISYQFQRIQNLFKFFNEELSATFSFIREFAIEQYHNLNMEFTGTFEGTLVEGAEIFERFFNTAIHSTATFFRESNLIKFFNTNIEGTASFIRNIMVEKFSDLKMNLEIIFEEAFQAGAQTFERFFNTNIEATAQFIRNFITERFSNLNTQFQSLFTRVYTGTIQYLERFFNMGIETRIDMWRMLGGGAAAETEACYKLDDVITLCVTDLNTQYLIINTGFYGVVIDV